MLVLLAAVAVAGCAAPSRHSFIARGLQSEDPAKRMAACTEAAQQQDRSAIPLLIDRLNDSESDVRFCAIRALKELTSQTMGYEYYQDESKRAPAVGRWRQWLRSQATSSPSPASASAPAGDGANAPGGTRP